VESDFGPGGFDFSNFTHVRDFDDIFGGGSPFGEIFSQIFGGGMGGFGRSGGRRGANHRGEDLLYELEIPFKDAVEGTKRTIKIPRLEKCEECSGSGSADGSGRKKCSKCGGAGEIRHVRRQGMFQQISVSPCGKCNGIGTFVENPCGKCRGSGKMEATQKVSVTIPPGIDDGQRLRLKGEGNAGSQGFPSGDLYVRVYVNPDRRFTRDGADIYTEEPITMVQAALGDNIEVETVLGRGRLKIPGGTMSGKIFRLGGQGMPFLNRPGNGDHYIKVIVDIPKKLSSRQKELLLEFARERGEAPGSEQSASGSKKRSWRSKKN